MEHVSLFTCDVCVCVVYTWVFACSSLCVSMWRLNQVIGCLPLLPHYPETGSPTVSAQCLGCADWLGIFEELPVFTTPCWSWRDMQLCSALHAQELNSGPHASRISTQLTSLGHISYSCVSKSPRSLMSSGSWGASGSQYVLPGGDCWMCAIVLVHPLKTTGRFQTQAFAYVQNQQMPSERKW